MSDPIAVAIIGATQAIIVTLIGVLFSRVGKVRRDAAATRDQIVNHHPDQPNFREENDTRHAETRGWFRDLKRDIGGIREEMRGMRETDRAQERRIQRLEDIEITDQGRKRP